VGREIKLTNHEMRWIRQALRHAREDRSIYGNRNGKRADNLTHKLEALEAKLGAALPNRQDVKPLQSSRWPSRKASALGYQLGRFMRMRHVKIPKHSEP
jgi:hypothetical protein